MNVISKPKKPGEAAPDTPVLNLLMLPNEMLEHILQVKWSYVIGPEFSEMDNFNKKKMGYGPPRHLYSKYDIYTPFISMVVLTAKTQIYITVKWF